MEKQVILLAGGTGLIGLRLQDLLLSKGHEVRVLTRGKASASPRRFHWDPEQYEIDRDALEGVSVIINLAGAGIADKRWTSSRKKELIDSRVVPTLFLASLAPDMPMLRHYISASGINCYGYDHPDKLHTEEDPFGTDFLSQVVEKWESAADSFLPFCPVAKVRISVVLTEKGGALETIARPVKLGFTAALGSGVQWMPWIHWKDLVDIFDFIMDHRLAGSFNAVSKVVNNETFTRLLAKHLHKKMWLPNVPGFILRLFLGEMSSVVLEGVNASNRKLRDAGYTFRYEDAEKALEKLDL